MTAAPPRQLPLLTPLRGFAALFVVFFHARLILFPQWKDHIASYTYFLENSYIWVDLFFILSGYVMVHVYRDAFKKEGVTFYNWWCFMHLRFSRVYPLFLVTLLALIGWESYKAVHGITFYAGPLAESWGMIGQQAFEGPFNHASSIFANLLMLQSIDNSPALSWNISSWSLSVEWIIYWFFPLIASCLLKTRGRSWAVPVIALLLIYSQIVQGNTLDYTKGEFALCRGLSGFVLGAWLCHCGAQALFSKLQGGIWIWGIIAGIVISMHVKPSPLSLMSTYILFAALVGVSAVQRNPKQFLTRVLDNRVTQILGDISYSVYLWHAVLILAGTEVIHYVAPEPLAWWYQQTSVISCVVGLIAFSGVTILVSTLSYRLIERPAQLWLRKRAKPVESNSGNLSSPTL